MNKLKKIVLLVYSLFALCTNLFSLPDTSSIEGKAAWLHGQILSQLPMNSVKSFALIQQGRSLPFAKGSALKVLLDIDLAEWYKNAGQFDSALRLGYRNLFAATMTRIDSLQLIASQNLGISYSRKGIVDSAMKYCLKSLKISEANKITKEIVRSLYFLGEIQQRVDNHSKALDYFSASRLKALESNDPFLIAFSIDGLASYYFNMGEYLKADSLFKNSLKIYERLNKKPNLARCYLNLGSCYDALGEHQSGIKNYQKALGLFQELRAHNDILLCYLNMGAIYGNMKSFSKAIENYTLAEKYANENNSTDNLVSIYENMADIGLQTHNYKMAHEFSEKYHSLKDSLLTTEKIKYLNELEAKYQTEKKENEIILLTKENLIKEAEAKLHKRRSALLLISTCLLVIISILVFFIFRQKALNAKRLAEKNEQLYRKKINEIIKEQELKSINEIMESQENERKRIAEDLHDRLGSMLATIKMHFNAVEQKIETIELKNMEQYHRANKLLDEVCDEVRKIAHNMESGALANFGLVHALEELKSALEHSSNLKITVSSFGMKGRFSHLIEISVYRVIQELISNVIKHAGASEITIDLNKTPEMLTVMVSDNGIGFDYDVAKNKDGMGLKNIQSRISKLNGRFYVDSGKKNGTTNIIEIPLSND